MTHTHAGWVRDRSTPAQDRARFRAALANPEAALQAGEGSVLSLSWGRLLDRLRFARGILRVGAETPPILLDAFAVRQRNAEGDDSPDPEAARYPAFEAPRDEPAPAPASSAKTSFTQRVEDGWAEQKAVGLKPSIPREPPQHDGRPRSLSQAR